METENLELDVDDLPPGYILIRKEDGMFAFLKMEPDDTEDVDGEDEQQHDFTEEIIEEGDADMEVNEDVVEDEYLQEEIDINVIPDIIEEDLPPAMSPESIEQIVTNDQVDFVDGTDRPSSKDTKQHAERKFKIQNLTANLWRGINIPPNLTRDEVERFKARHLLQRLSERVKRNRQKVDIYEKKNDSLRSLIANQRDQMVKLGFHIKDIVRHHNVRKKIDPGPRFPSPLMAPELMNELERIEYEKSRLEIEYNHLRKRLKTLLSGYRRYKKVFVENHEKLKKGPKRRENTLFYTKKESIRMHQATQDSDSDSDTAKLSKPFKCYHCRFMAATKAELRSHIEGHLTQKQYECCVCPYFAYRITPFLEHMKTHPGAKAFRCKHCDFRTAYPSAMRNHEATHLTIKPYKCLICSFRTVRSDHLRNHMRRHKNDRAFKCDRCPYTAKYSSGLCKHKKTVHAPNYVAKRKPQLKTYAKKETESDSEDAGETTEIEIDENGKMLFVRHLGKSSKKQFSDGQEERRRSSRQNVKRAMTDYVEGDEFDDGEIIVGEEIDENDQAIKEETIMEEGGEGEIVEEEENESDAELRDGEVITEQDESAEELVDQKPHKGKDLLSSYVIYQCVFCEFSCEMKHNLILHLRSHMEYWNFTCRACNFTANNPSDLQTHTEDHRNEGESSCPYCDHVTNNREKLRKHVDKRHPPGKPLACIYCSYISSSRSSMKAHMQGHKSKKVWQCLICNYKAEFRSGLKRHLRKHTGERPYHCPHCEFNAAQYSHLTRHLRKNHPNEPLLETRPASPFVIL